jgi:putative membrane protein
MKATDMMGWYGGGMGGGAWIFMGLFWVILIAAIIWLVVRLLPSSSHSGATTAAPHQVSGHESPLDVLDRRFASGELDLETYQAQRAALIAARGSR